METMYKILIAESEKIIALDMRRILEKEGYQITSIVDNGLDVLQKIASEKPDLVLIDIMLNSRLDGIDTANIIESKYKIPIIYLTAKKDEPTIKRVKTTSVSEYLIKPFDGNNLCDKVKETLERLRF